MAYVPVSNINFQYDKNINYWLKFYIPNTTTPISMSIDDVGTTLFAKAQIGGTGFPTTDGTTLFIPFLDQSYDAWLFPTEAEADANDTANALRVADNINPFGADFNLDIVNFKPVISPGQTSITVPDAPSSINLIVNGDVQELKVDESDTGSYTYSGGIIDLVSDAFIGDETVVVQYGLIAPKTTLRPDGMTSYASVSQMVADTGLAVGERIVTYQYNKKVTSFWEIVSTGAGDLSDKTLLLNNGLYARIQILPEMEFRAFGTFGDGGNDDSDAIINTIKNSPKSVGNPDDSHFVTKHLDASISNRSVQGRGAKILWNGVAGPIHVVGRDRGIFEIKGEIGPVLDKSGVFTQWLEGATQYPTNDSSLIVNEDYLVVSAGSPPSVSVALLLKPLASVTSPNTRVQLDYVLGWNLFNIQWTYRKVVVIENVVIEGFDIIDETNPDGTDTTVSGVVMQFAADCHVKNISSTNVWFPTTFAYFVSDCTLDNIYVNPATASNNPDKFGQCVQWNNAYRCHASKLDGQGTRRISDFTACAHCSVRDSGGENTLDGEFTTHGVYEHNLYYENTRGVLSFANSGPLFGETAKNITVINHRGPTINMSKNVYDAHLMHCLCNFYNLNSVGLVVDNCNLYTDGVTPKNFQINNWSRSLGFTPTTTKPTVIMNSEIQASSPGFLVDQDISAEDSVHFINCKIDLQQGDFAGPANIKMTYCDLTGSTLVLIANPTKVEIINCNSLNVAWGILDDLTLVTGGVNFRVSGGTIKGENFASAMFANRDESQLGIECRMVFENVDIEWDDDVIIESPLGTRNPDWYDKISGNTFINTGVGAGTIRVSNQHLLGFYFTDNKVSSSVTLDIGAASATRIIRDTIVI